MIIGGATKYGAGITLYGDYYDLNSVRDTINSLADRQPLTATLGTFVLGLAYDLRHAYQRDRESRLFGFDEYDRVTYQGVSILWPVFLVQLGLLRWAAAFNPTTRETQSNLFRLEACAESALTSYEPVFGKKVFDWVTHFDGLPSTYLTEYVFNCSLRYVTHGKPGKARFKCLPHFLDMISPLSTGYGNFEAHLKEIAKQKNCRPEDLNDWGDWPEFKW